MRYGVIPAGGLGTRLQPLGFSKELAPVRGRAVIEFLLERMVLAGLDKIFVTTAADKTDLIQYLGSKSPYKNKLIFMVRDRQGLTDGIIQPAPYLRPEDWLYFGLPDTIWYPKSAYKALDHKRGNVVLGLFPAEHPEHLGVVEIDNTGKVLSIKEKPAVPASTWVWGIGKIKASELAVIANPVFTHALADYAAAHVTRGVTFKQGEFLDIGQHEDYAKANTFVKAHEL